MLIESMLNSKIKKRRIDEEMKSLKAWPLDDSTSLDNTNSEVQVVSDEYSRSRDTRRDFNHKSYLKLRNLFYLLILLKTQPFLRDHRSHRLCDKSRYDTDKNESFFDSFDRQKRRFKKPGKFGNNKTNTKLFFKEAQAQEVQIQKNLAEISHIQANNNDDDDRDPQKTLLPTTNLKKTRFF